MLPFQTSILSLRRCHVTGNEPASSVLPCSSPEPSQALLHPAQHTGCFPSSFWSWGEGPGPSPSLPPGLGPLLPHGAGESPTCQEQGGALTAAPSPHFAGWAQASHFGRCCPPPCPSLSALFLLVYFYPELPPTLSLLCLHCHISGLSGGKGDKYVVGGPCLT